MDKAAAKKAAWVTFWVTLVIVLICALSVGLIYLLGILPGWADGLLAILAVLVIIWIAVYDCITCDPRQTLQGTKTQGRG